VRTLACCVADGRTRVIMEQICLSVPGSPRGVICLLGSRNGRLWNVSGFPDHSYCGLMLAARITLPHFSVSSAMSLP
jgi:hypothetical protein